MADSVEVAALDADAARRLTERIRVTAGTVAESVKQLRSLVQEAKDGRAHEALGYESWTAYLVDVFGDEPLRLARDVRQELVAELAAQGMSTRAIAPIVGVTQETVAQDIKAPVRNLTPDSAEPIHVDPDTGVVFEPKPVTATEESVTTTRTITGLDGKTYARAEPVTRRSSLAEEARGAGWQLQKAAERIERIAADDRFGKNKAEVMAALQPHLDFANKVLSDL
jgi:hypothetical protein